MFGNLLRPIGLMVDRLEQARSDSDAAWYYDLMYFGELLTKLAVAGLVASLPDDPDRHRYRLEYELMRGDSLGAWAKAMDDLLTGPASALLTGSGQEVRNELTKKVRRSHDDWRGKCVDGIEETLESLSNITDRPRRVALRQFFPSFVQLRNDTRAHGAPTAEQIAVTAPKLWKSLEGFAVNFSLFSRYSWAYVRRNLSGKYRVLPLSATADEFSFLKSESDHTFRDGVYVYLDRPCSVELVTGDLESVDFYLPNGTTGANAVEWLCYTNGSRDKRLPDRHGAPPSELPPSETDARPHLDLLGNSFSNLPPRVTDYVERPFLQEELNAALCTDRHAIVTLKGRGGIGKTSLALRVLHDVAESGPFFTILWFSSRDIDLQPGGPKLVRPQILSIKDVAETFGALMGSGKGNDTIEGFAEALRHSDVGPLLLVFDNFETLTSPSDVYAFLDTNIRPPNKILITTRVDKSFRGDYPVEVHGMERSEFRILVEATANRIGIGELIDSATVDRLYGESDGHPYVAKVLLGEFARDRHVGSVERVLARRDDILDALFQRTYEMLGASAQRVFLMLGGWRAVVPRIGVDAALLRTEVEDRIDVDAAVDELLRASLVESSFSEADGTEFLSVPSAAAVFSKRKLQVSPHKPVIEADLQALQAFGAGGESDVRNGLGPRLVRVLRAAARTADLSERQRLVEMVEIVASDYPPAWLAIAEYQMDKAAAQESSSDSTADEALEKYLEQIPTDSEAWRKLHLLREQKQDYQGAAQALIERARLAGAPYDDASFAANKVNSYFADQRLQLDTDTKRLLVIRLLGELESRIDEATGTDLSRIVWLCMHAKRLKAAREYLRRGLELDPQNPYLLRLKRRLNG